MKIVWASPFGLASAIGRVSADVCQALTAAGHQLTLISTELDPLEPGAAHPTLGAVRHWSSGLQALLAEADCVFVSIGDHYLNHAGIFPILAHSRCIGVFHDYYLYNLFCGWLAAHKLSAERHDAEVVATYGAAALATAQAARSGHLGLAELAAQIPMSEWIAARCGGALAHSAFYVPRLRAACAGPVAIAPLPVTGRGVPALSRQRARSTTVMTVGVMNPNKCVDRVISALGTSDALRDHARYRLVGPISDVETARLRALAKTLSFPGLDIFGAVTEAELAEHLGHADIIACLRSPVLEGASGSAVEGLLAGRPLIVADAGFYQDLPDDLVVKIGPDVTVEDIQAALEHLHGDQDLRRDIGARAQAWALSHFTVRKYVDILTVLMASAQSASPLIDLGARIGRELKALGVRRDDPVIDRIAAEINKVLPTHYGEDASSKRRESPLQS